MIMPVLLAKSGHNSQGSLNSYFIKKSVIKINQEVSNFSEKRNFLTTMASFNFTKNKSNRIDVSSIYLLEILLAHI